MSRPFAAMRAARVGRREVLAGLLGSAAVAAVGCITPAFADTASADGTAGPATSGTAATPGVPAPGPASPPDQVFNFTGRHGLPWSAEWSPVISAPYLRDGGVQSYQGGRNVLFIDGEGHGVIRAYADPQGNWRSAMVYGPTLLYGSVTVRAKLPTGQGIFPAIWTLAADTPAPHSWPDHGEIDIVEIYNTGTTALQTVHYPSDLTNSKGYFYPAAVAHSETLEPGWHVYRLDRHPEFIRISIDGVEVHTFLPTDLPPGKWSALQYPQMVVLNQCIGGWHGPPDDTTPTPSDMLIDFVRITHHTHHHHRTAGPPAS